MSSNSNSEAFHPIPAAALKRFAEDLGRDSKANRFLQINKERVYTFIEKQYQPRETKKNQSLATITNKTPTSTNYDFTLQSAINSSFITLQDNAAFNQALGARSRFGEGDGSFFDRWLNADLLTSKHAVDKDHLPQMKFSLNQNQNGFKKLIEDHRKIRKSAAYPDYYVKPYAERREERLRREKEEQKASEMGTTKETVNSHQSKYDLPNADSFNSRGVRLPSISSTMSVTETSNYFGQEAKAAFFDYYRQMVRQQNTFSVASEERNSPKNFSHSDNDEINKEPKQSIASLVTDRIVDKNVPKSESFARKKAEMLAEDQELSTAQIIHQHKENKISIGKLEKSVLIGRGNNENKDSATLKASSDFGEEIENRSLRPFSSEDSSAIRRETYSRLRPRGVLDSDVEKQQLMEKLFDFDGMSVGSESNDNFSVDSSSTLELINRPIVSPSGARPVSARTKFLQGVVGRRLLPRAALVIRKEHSSYLNLASFGIGNEMAVVLAEALDSVPMLEGLNIADNNLDDRGLVPIVHKLALCKNLLTFDLSNNKVDAKTAAALRSFLSSGDCNLNVLIMQNANVDDYEAYLFMETIAVRNTIEELDLSRNLLGSHELARKKDVGTAGEMIGRVLQSSQCSLKILKLAWNTIRYSSGIAIVHSLKFNHTLVHLDLSYNGLGVDGGEVLGSALLSNRTLRVLNVANNNITARACFTIFSGAKSCESLEELDLSGNPIGEEGIRCILMLNISHGYRLKIEIKNCSVKVQDPSFWFDVLHPSGEHVLELNKPFDRAVGIELLRAVARDQTLQLQKCRVTNGENDSNGVDVELAIHHMPLVGATVNKETVRQVIAASGSGMRAASFGEDGVIAQLREAGEDLQSIRELFRETANRIFKQYDSDESGSLDRDELLEIVDQLGFEEPWIWVDKLLSIYDTDNSGRVEEDEFIGFLIDVKASFENDASFGNDVRYVFDHRDPKNAKRLATQEHPEPFIPPESGKLHLVIEAQPALSGLVKILSSKQVDSFLSASKAVPESSELIELALTTSRWTIGEAQSFFHAMVKETGNVIQVLLKLLPHMASPLDARMLIAYVTGHEFQQVQHLKYLLGPLYRIYIGIPNGFYSLQLAESNDREALRLLFALSRENAELRKKLGKGDTSQCGDWSGFRNAIFDGNPLTITPKFMEELPDSGNLQFDFISVKDVSMKENIISNLRLYRLLAALGVTNDSKRKRMFTKIQQYSSDGRLSAKGSGTKKYEIPPNAAQQIALQLQTMYENYASDRRIRPYTIDLGKEEQSLLEGKKRLRKLAAAVANGNSQRRLTVSNRSNRRLLNTNSRRRDSASSNNYSSFTSAGTSSISSTTSENTANSSGAGEEQPIDEEARIKHRESLFRIPEQAFQDEGEVKSMEMYGAHIKDMVDNVLMDRELVAARVLDALETILAGRYLSCAQLGIIIERFPFGHLLMNGFSTYRVELIVSLYSRIVDIVNFEFAVKELESFEIGMLLFRLGWLNIWNPLKPEGNICLDLSRREEKQVARMLITLNYVEKGDTWIEPNYRLRLENEPEKDWRLPVTWFAENTLPSTGFLSLQYFSGKGVQLQGCEPNVACRMSLMSLVFPQPYEDDLWHENDSAVQRAQDWVDKMGFKLQFSAHWSDQS